MNRDLHNDILVSISCITYNHVQYISQCLDGFLMQKTSFPFEVLIHDDCSTDGTVEIIKEYEEKYPDIIKPIYEEENQYQQGKPSGSAVWNFPRARGKYIAICEGDDFWIDQFKLQKQVDILESNPDVTFVYTAFKTVDNNGAEIFRKFFDDCMKKSKSGYIVDSLLRGNFILTLTSCFRASVLTNKSCLSALEGYSLDYYYFMKSALQGPVIYLPDVTGAYRQNPEGAVAKSKKTILKTFREIYKISLKDFIKLPNSKINYSLTARLGVCFVALYRAIRWYIDGSDKKFIFDLFRGWR